jgi:hypothetical protein
MRIEGPFQERFQFGPVLAIGTIHDKQPAIRSSPALLVWTAGYQFIYSQGTD